MNENINKTILKQSAMQLLIDNFGNVGEEPFDYTKWQENLYEDMSVEQLSKKAMDFKNSK